MDWVLEIIWILMYWSNKKYFVCNDRLRLVFKWYNNVVSMVILDII